MLNRASRWAACRWWLLIPALGLIAMAIAWTRATNVVAADSVFVPDKGHFTIQLGGQPVGEEEFEISLKDGNWLAKGETHLKPPDGPSSTVTGSLLLQPNGVPVSYEWAAKTDKSNRAQIQFVNGVAQMTLEMQGARPFQQNLNFGTPLIAVLDNNLYDQYAVLARVYDWSRKGTQTLPVIIPQELTPGSITIEDAGQQQSDGESYEGLRVSTSDLQVLLFLDPHHRLMRLEVPSAKVSVVRQ